MKPPKPKNPQAVALGRLAKGKKKRYSTEELAKRTERLKLARERKINKLNTIWTKGE